MNTSWGKVADWYGEHLEGADTYHAKVVAPNLVRLVGAEKGKHILEIGCGEGYFARMFAEAGADVVGADISPELIAQAQRKEGRVTYHATSADNLSFAHDASFDVVVAVLTLQNMERIEPVVKEIARVSKPGGSFIFVLNHPAFRIPKRSAWGWDGEKEVQYRRLDGYLSASREKIDMTPGSSEKKSTPTHSTDRSKTT